MFDITELPAQRLSPEQVSELPALTDPQVGDVVGIYSRGAWRVAVIEKVGKTNITARYTTEGAWKTAQKIHEGQSNPARIEQAARYAATMAATNFAFAVRESNEDTARYDRTPEQIARYASEVAEGLDGYVARKTQEARDKQQASYEQAVSGGVAQYVHPTRKSVKIADAVKVVFPAA